MKLKCKGAPNFELNKERNRTIEYTIIEPDKKSKGLVFFISCFGLEQDYIDKWLQKAANQYDLTAVSVKYHCWHSRPETGANILVPPDAELKIKGLCVQENIPFISDVNMLLRVIGNNLKQQVYLTGLLLQDPTEKQNFGLIQALDHLYVLNDIVKRDIKTDFNNIILFGSSHGGYLAHLIAKLAPNTIRLIIDNSSYISPPPQYMGLGAEFSIVLGNLYLGLGLENSWQHEIPHLDNYYNTHNRMIRDVANDQHLSYYRMNLKRQVQVLSYNTSQTDTISPPEDKEYQQQIYKENGFDYELTLIDKVDNVFKEEGHGMGASLWPLFKLSMKNDLLIRKTVLDVLNKTELLFECGSAEITVKHGGTLPVEIEINKYRTH